MTSHKLVLIVVLAALGLPALTRSVNAQPGPDARQSALALLESVAQEPERDRQLVAQLVSRARAALDRAETALAAKRPSEAAQLHALALTWARTSRALLDADARENQLHSQQEHLAELQQQLARMRALLEETLARLGRARVSLEKLTSGDAEAPGEAE